MMWRAVKGIRSSVAMMQAVVRVRVASRFGLVEGAGIDAEGIIEPVITVVRLC